MNNEENQKIIESTITLTEEINNKNEEKIPFNKEEISKIEKINDSNEDLNIQISNKNYVEEPNQTEEFIETHTTLITEKMDEKEPNENNLNEIKEDSIEEQIVEDNNINFNDNNIIESNTDNNDNNFNNNDIKENDINNNIINDDKENENKENNISEESNKVNKKIIKKIIYKEKNIEREEDENSITIKETTIEKHEEKKRRSKRKNKENNKLEGEENKEIKTSSYRSKERRNKKNLNDNISENNFIEEFLYELNLLRTSPKNYKEELEEYENNIKKSLSYKPNILKEISKLISKLKNGKNSNEIKQNEKLNELSNEYLNELKYTKGRIFYPKDQEILEEDLNSIFEKVTFCKNYVCTNNNPKKALLEILFNEKDLIKGVSDRLVNSESKYIGISHEKIRNQFITVIIITDNINEKKELNFEDELLNEINHFRNNPQFYLKFFNNNNEIYDKILYAKKVPSLKLNDILNKACEERGILLSNNPKEKYNRNELIEFLDNYGTNFFIVNEYINDEKESAQYFLIEMLKNDYQILLNRRLKEFGFARNEKGKIILIFVDNIIPNKNIKEITINNLTNKLNRPEFTLDEENQIRNDFKNFDSLNLGIIKPSIILIFADKDKDFANRNPFYYTALKDLNTEENNIKGINEEQFVNAVKRVIREYDAEDFENNWAEIFNLYFGEKRNNVIDKNILVNVIKDLGFKLSDDDINLVLDKVDCNLDLEKFTNIMKEIELNFRLKLNN